MPLFFGFSWPYFWLCHLQRNSSVFDCVVDKYQESIRMKHFNCIARTKLHVYPVMSKRSKRYNEIVQELPPPV